MPSIGIQADVHQYEVGMISDDQRNSLFATLGGPDNFVAKSAATIPSSSTIKIAVLLTGSALQN
jgi:hypothetical protein